MRFLNKIVFINSATIRYAEVMVDGNVHLIGTQGVGKSTLLRALLFFYNADTLRLGISREKKSFAEYYFPFQNAWLVYEVMRETGPFCIMAFKSQGKVCFRFLDGAYHRDWFVNAEGRALEKWEDISRQLNALGISYTRKIDRYEEYRDIVYGNNETGKREFAAFALLQSKQYQNIPRTIQNVFLNSKLEAEFIKRTIIMSLNEEDISIDLHSYTHHLKDFEQQLNDIFQYRQPAVQKQAEDVVRFHLAIRHLEREKNQAAQYLVWTAALLQRQLPKMLEKLDKQQDEKQALLDKMENSEQRYRLKADKIKGEISVLENELKKAKDKTEYYTRLDIDSIIQKLSLKAAHEAHQQQLLKEKNLLTAQYTALTQKYDALKSASDNSYQQNKHALQQQSLQGREDMMKARENLHRWLENNVTEIKDQHQQVITLSQQALQQAEHHYQQVRLHKASITHQRFYETEMAEARQQLADADMALRQATLSGTGHKSQIELFTRQWEAEEEKAKQQIAWQQKLANQNIEQLENKAAQIRQNLESSQHALYGWLNTNKPGWESNIGKVVDETVLFSHHLSPSSSGTSNHFYGIQLNLDELDIKVKSLDEYQQELSALETNMAKARLQLQQLETELATRLDKLRKKYQPQIKEAKDQEREQQYQQQLQQQALLQAQLWIKDLDIKARDARHQALQQADEAIAAASEQQEQAQQHLQTLQEALDKQIKSREREHKKRGQVQQQEEESLKEKIDQQLKELEQKHEEELGDIEARQRQELAGKGADTSRLAQIDQALQELQMALDYIEKNRDMVAQYRQDKKELLDKAEDFKQNKMLMEQRQAIDEEKHRQQKAQSQVQIAEVVEKLERLKEQIKEAEADSQAFNQFQLTDNWQAVESMYKEEKEAFKNEKNCRQWIDIINRSTYDSIRRMDDLKESTHKFLGHFSQNNVFKFPALLTGKSEYRQFAEDLNDFVANSKIEEYEKRVNERFSTIILSLGKETALLMSRQGDIQKVIHNINKDFDSKNFVGAIRKIELRIDDSANKVVQLLQLIRAYNDEHGYDLGGLNLFSSVNQDAKNKKAVDLLRQLGKAITEQKSDQVALSDSFELKFRVEENNNDTGWVEKLANVGSEGTDVLVKAMINIMLLNVFKEGASKRFRDFNLHCMMDEIGKLHPNNVRGILQFANDRNIWLINGSPTENNALDYRHIYKLEKDEKRNTRIKRILTNHALA